MSLIDTLIEQKWLQMPHIIEAFRKIKRVDFMPQEMRALAEANRAIPIGHGQTISQPLVVAFMMELLKPEPDHKILDVGSGSGWTTAILAEIVADKSKVFAIEIVPELKEFGEKKVDKYGSYDRILVSATALNTPDNLKQQLKVGGILVLPVRQSIWIYTKKSDTDFDEKEHYGFSFVPLIGGNTK
jgi:protein-L-isoaspartate(D-aspartate) O-methyltransferase